MATTFELKGAKELKAKLEGLSYDMRYKGGRFALRKAAQLVESQAKANALRVDDPTTGRQIAHNIALRWNGRLFKATGNLGFRIGVMGGAEGQRSNPDLGLGGKTFHWRFLELGTEKQREQPFMRPALASQTEAVGTEFVQQYNVAIDRALKRLGK